MAAMMSVVKAVKARVKTMFQPRATPVERQLGDDLEVGRYVRFPYEPYGVDHIRSSFPENENLMTVGKPEETVFIADKSKSTIFTQPGTPYTSHRMTQNVLHHMQNDIKIHGEGIIFADVGKVVTLYDAMTKSWHDRLHIGQTTNLLDGLLKALELVKVLNRTRAKPIRHITILTDGQCNEIYDHDKYTLRTIEDLAAELAVTFTIGICPENAQKHAEIKKEVEAVEAGACDPNAEFKLPGCGTFSTHLKKLIPYIYEVIIIKTNLVIENGKELSGWTKEDYNKYTKVIAGPAKKTGKLCVAKYALVLETVTTPPSGWSHKTVDEVCAAYRTCDIDRVHREHGDEEVIRIASSLSYLQKEWCYLEEGVHRQAHSFVGKFLNTCRRLVSLDQMETFQRNLDAGSYHSKFDSADMLTETRKQVDRKKSFKHCEEYIENNLPIPAAAPEGTVVMIIGTRKGNIIHTTKGWLEEQLPETYNAANGTVVLGEETYQIFHVKYTPPGYNHDDFIRVFCRKKLAPVILALLNRGGQDVATAYKKQFQNSDQFYLSLIFLVKNHFKVDHSEGAVALTDLIQAFVRKEQTFGDNVVHNSVEWEINNQHICEGFIKPDIQRFMDMTNFHIGYKNVWTFMVREQEGKEDLNPIVSLTVSYPECAFLYTAFKADEVMYVLRSEDPVTKKFTVNKSFPMCLEAAKHWHGQRHPVSGGKFDMHRHLLEVKPDDPNRAAYGTRKADKAEDANLTMGPLNVSGLVPIMVEDAKTKEANKKEMAENRDAKEKAANETFTVEPIMVEDDEEKEANRKMLEKTNKLVVQMLRVIAPDAPDKINEKFTVEWVTWLYNPKKKAEPTKKYREKWKNYLDWMDSGISEEDGRSLNTRPNTKIRKHSLPTPQNHWSQVCERLIAKQ